MDQIGTSHLVLADVIVWGLAIALFWHMKSAPVNSVLSRVAAALAVFAVVAIMAVLPLAANITSNGALELAMIGIWLCMGLGDWHARRKKAQLRKINP